MLSKCKIMCSFRALLGVMVTKKVWKVQNVQATVKIHFIVPRGKLLLVLL